MLFYQDNAGIQHESYEAACIYYGADTPAQLELEAQYWAELEADMAAEAKGDIALLDPEFDEIPF